MKSTPMLQSYLTSLLETREPFSIQLENGMILDQLIVLQFDDTLLKVEAPAVETEEVKDGEIVWIFYEYFLSLEDISIFGQPFELLKEEKPRQLSIYNPKLGVTSNFLSGFRGDDEGEEGVTA